MINFFYVVLAALGLGFLVFVHELGHYWAARMAGITVEIFSIGFGKPIWRKKHKGVEWRIGWLPVGGYVRMAGMEKRGGLQPYQIRGGFFHASPFKRILVALAGPFINLLLAFLFFVLIYALGGRQQPFADFSNHVGWVDPRSELYAKGVRPGDTILAYDGHRVEGMKDHIYGAMFAGESVFVEGLHFNSQTGKKEPFKLQVPVYQDPTALEEGVKTLGVLRPAQYLLFLANEKKELPPSSPMASSGITKGDRLLWAEGEFLFSSAQLSYLLNEQRSLMTIERQGKRFLMRVPRVRITDLAVDSELSDELRDWQYELQSQQKRSPSFFIPYVLSAQAVVQGRIPFIDREAEKEFFPAHPFSLLEEPLQVGDRIVAVNGIPVQQPFDLFQHLQNRRIHLIVERQPKGWPIMEKESADRIFDQELLVEQVQALARTIGTTSPKILGTLVLLDPIEPTTLSALAKASGKESLLLSELQEKRQEIEKISDPGRRAIAYEQLEGGEHRWMLGLPLEDRQVRLNPSPLSQFWDVVADTGRTLRALLVGNLSPKWLSGPVGIVQVIHHGWTLGLSQALFWLAVISLNLGILNLLPIPVLDGGHITFALWEMVTKRRMKAETMERLVIPFIVLLVLFFLFVTYQDILRLVRHLF